EFLDGVGVSGRFPDPVGDLLAVTTSNAAGNKIDLFARRSIGYEVDWDPSTGAVEATMTLTLANDAPTTGYPDYVIGNALGRQPIAEQLPVGWNNSLVTVYTPYVVLESTLDGEQVFLQRNVEAGANALSTFVAVPPGGERTLVIRLAGTYQGEVYELDVVGQPMVNPDRATVSITVAGGGRVDTEGPVEDQG